MTDVTPSAEAFAAEAGTTPVVVANDTATVPATSNVNNVKFYTEDDLSKVRSQEKDKLYPVIEELKVKLSSLEKEKEERAAKRSEEEAELAAKHKAKLEEDLDTKELLKVKEQEFLTQLNAEREERQKAFALLERERMFSELTSYKSRRIEEEREGIIPELVDLINGSSPDEVEESIQALKDRSSRILDSVQQASQAARRDMAGTRATLPAAGPLDINSENRSFTAEEIAAMPMNEYAKYRNRIMSDSARGVTKGIFG